MNELQVIVNNVENRHISDLTYKASQSIHCVEAIKDQYKVDAKSLLGLLSLGLRVGDVVTFRSEDNSILCEIREHLE